MTDMNMFAVIAITVTGSIGLTLLFFAALISIAHAFGSKRIAWGVICILLLPVSGVYCLVYWKETPYPRKYIFMGLGVLFLSLVAYLFL